MAWSDGRRWTGEDGRRYRPRRSGHGVMLAFDVHPDVVAAKDALIAAWGGQDGEAMTAARVELARVLELRHPRASRPPEQSGVADYRAKLARKRARLAAARQMVPEEQCPGHVASDVDPRTCGRCGVHVDSLRPLEEDGGVRTWWGAPTEEYERGPF